MAKQKHFTFICASLLFHFHLEKKNYFLTLYFNVLVSVLYCGIFIISFLPFEPKHSPVLFNNIFCFLDKFEIAHSIHNQFKRIFHTDFMIISCSFFVCLFRNSVCDIDFFRWMSKVVRNVLRSTVLRVW